MYGVQEAEAINRVMHSLAINRGERLRKRRLFPLSLLRTIRPPLRLFLDNQKMQFIT